MPLHHKVSTTWKTITPWVKVGTVWKTATLWHNVSGVWKQISSTLSSLLPSAISAWDMQIAPTDAYTDLVLSSSGTWSSAGGGGSGTWRGGGASSDYECRMTNVSGTVSSGTVGSWLNLGTTQSWSVVYTSNQGFKSYTGTLEVRMAASPFTVLSTTTVNLQAEVET